MMNQTWMAHIPRMAPPSDKPKPEPRIATPTLRSMRAGQHPMFPPKPAKVPPDRPTNYMDDGGPPTADQPWWVGATGSDTRLPPVAPPVDLPAQDDRLPEPIPAADLPPSTDPVGMEEEPPEEKSIEQEMLDERKANPHMDEPAGGLSGGPMGGQRPGQNNAIDDLEAQYRYYPEKHEPKWWQRAAGAAAGFGAGWSNAASRTRHPIDIGAMEQNILYPGNRSKLEQWTSKTIPQTAIVNIEAAKAKQQIAQQKQNSEDAYQQSQGDLNRARGDYYRGVGRNAMVPVTDEMVAQSGGLLKKGQQISQQSFEEMLKIGAGKYEKPGAKQFIPIGPNGLYDSMKGEVIGGVPKDTNPNEWGLYLKAAGGNEAKAIANWRQDKMAIAQGSRDPNVGEMRRESQQEHFAMDSNAIDARKLSEEGQAHAAYRMEVAAGTDPAQAQGHLQATLQGIQDNYARTIRNRGGSATDQEVVPSPGGGFQYRPRGQGAAPQQQQAAPQKISTQAQFDALPKGAVYFGEDGKKYQKP